MGKKTLTLRAAFEAYGAEPRNTVSQYSSYAPERTLVVSASWEKRLL